MSQLINVAWGVGGFFLSSMGFATIGASIYQFTHVLEEREARSAGATFGAGVALLVVSALLWWKAL